MTRVWLSIHVACGGFVSLSLVNPQPAEHSPLFWFNGPQNLLPIEICTYHHRPGEAPLGLHVCRNNFQNCPADVYTTHSICTLWNIQQQRLTNQFVQPHNTIITSGGVGLSEPWSSHNTIVWERRQFIPSIKREQWSSNPRHEEKGLAGPQMRRVAVTHFGIPGSPSLSLRSSRCHFQLAFLFREQPRIYTPTNLV